MHAKSYGGSRGGSGGSVEPPKLNVKTYNKRVVNPSGLPPSTGVYPNPPSSNPGSAPGKKHYSVLWYPGVVYVLNVVALLVFQISGLSEQGNESSEAVFIICLGPAF